MAHLSLTLQLQANAVNWKCMSKIKNNEKKKSCKNMWSNKVRINYGVNKKNKSLGQKWI